MSARSLIPDVMLAERVTDLIGDDHTELTLRTAEAEAGPEGYDRAKDVDFQEHVAQEYDGGLWRTDDLLMMPDR